ncbi:CopG family transcriptional regulator [Pinisolibacter aquiterrae]|nr:CopG family transcriptional regulator [Pinisolibacter aquiterrae]MCC8235588.1 ribbon-helix-helix domain-containing protein [Pinisolibacter aquiterrae]
MELRSTAILATGRTIRTTVLLPEGVHRQVQALAAANDVSSAWVIRQAVLHYLATKVGQTKLPFGSDRS